MFSAPVIFPKGCTWQDWFNEMPANDREIWNEYLDPKNFLTTQHAPIMFVTGTNDHCYYLTTFQKSYEQVPVGKNLLSHPQSPAPLLRLRRHPALAWLDQKLSGATRFPRSTSARLLKRGDKVVLPAGSRRRPVSRAVRLYYTIGGPQQWTEKKWLAIVPYEEKGTYYFGVPAGCCSRRSFIISVQ